MMQKTKRKIPPRPEFLDKPRRRAWVPEDKHHEIARAMAGYGFPVEDICLMITRKGGKPIGKNTLRRHFAEDLRTGRVKANFSVIGSLYKNAVDGKNIAAQIFWAKTRCRWRETSNLEVTGRDGSPLFDLKELSKLSLEELKSVRDALLKVGVKPAETPLGSD